MRSKGTCLVTGSNGFIGSHLCRYLEEQGYEVVAGDRKGTVPKGIDYIYDLASYGNLFGQDDKKEIERANVVRVKKLLENAKGCKAVVLTSSSSVTLPNLTPYAKAKLQVEELAKSSKLPVSVIRPYTIYGPGDHGGHLIPRVFASCMQGEPLVLDPPSIHDYVWVGDIIQAYLEVVKDKKCRGEVIPVGTGIPASNAEVVIRIQCLTRVTPNIVGLKLPRDYDTHDWYAKAPYKKGMVSLQEGLNRIFNGLIRQRVRVFSL